MEFEGVKVAGDGEVREVREKKVEGEEKKVGGESEGEREEEGWADEDHWVDRLPKTVLVDTAVCEGRTLENVGKSEAVLDMEGVEEVEVYSERTAVGVVVEVSEW